MKVRKLLSLILTLCLVFTTIGTMGMAANAETTVTATVNVPQNVTYTLPETVNEQAVIWTPATVDTSKIGYNKMDNLKAVCEEYGIPCIDMATLTTEYLQGLKDNPDTDIDEQDVESKKLYMCDIYYSWDSVYKNLRDWSADDAFANEAYRSGQYGMQDNTHCTMYGAAVWAQLLTKTLKEKYPDILLSQYIINSDKTISYPWGTIE